MNRRTFLSTLALMAACSALPARSAPQIVPDSTLPGAAAFMGPLRTVRAGNITMGYRRFGKGPALVCIVGQDASMALWDPTLMRRLAVRFDVVIFDNRGVGRSTDDTAVPMTMQLMAQDTANLVAALGLRSAHVLGWSMGGEIALTLATTHPRTIGRLVVSGATAGGSTEVPPSQAVIDVLASPKTTPAQLFALLFPQNAGAAEAAYGRSLALTRPEPVPAVTQQRQSAAQLAFFKNSSVYNALPAVRIPTLVTFGTRDQIVPPANAKIIASRIPHARLDAYVNAGHAMLFQEPDRFARDVTQFLLAR